MFRTWGEGKLKNDYLLELLHLQQDGKQAISAPTNWMTQEPLLDVDTEIDKTMKDIGDSILLAGNIDRIARWHFLIGSPGNGKSAAVGKLCRYLVDKRNCCITDEYDCPIQELKQGTIPYELSIYENGNPFSTAKIIQDASVVKNPFLPNVDPSNDLISAVKEAWSKGISLVVCANRGVLEKAYWENHVNRDINREPWFRIIKELAESDDTINGKLQDTMEFIGKKAVFKKVRITYSHLENRSLLICNDIFDRLLKKAIDKERWEPCLTCNEIKLCPFKANQEWLSKDNCRGNFIKILKRVEVYSGQVIVFREAQALISLILAGCPRDYSNNLHPCDWVRSRIDQKDFFSLACRRIYMVLFASHNPLGLEVNAKLRKEQVNAFKEFARRIKESSIKVEEHVKATLDNIIKGRYPSTDLGVTRLLGEEGIFSQLNPMRETLPQAFMDLWDGDYYTIKDNMNPLITDIEKICLDIWQLIEQYLEHIPGHVVLGIHWHLRRWRSNFLMSIGFLSEGLTAWSYELDEYIELLEILSLSKYKEPSLDDKRKVKELNEKLESMIDIISLEESKKGKVYLTDFVSLDGDWVKGLKPKIQDTVDNLSLVISFRINREGNKNESARVSAPLYLWLSRYLKKKLDPRCIPVELIQGIIDAMVRAASKGDYAYVDDIEMIINAGTDGYYHLDRDDGEVYVEHEPRIL